MNEDGGAVIERPGEKKGCLRRFWPLLAVLMVIGVVVDNCDSDSDSDSDTRPPSTTRAQATTRPPSTTRAQATTRPPSSTRAASASSSCVVGMNFEDCQDRLGAFGQIPYVDCQGNRSVWWSSNWYIIGFSGGNPVVSKSPLRCE